MAQRVVKVREELTRFLDDDSDMRELYLTRKNPESIMDKGMQDDTQSQASPTMISPQGSLDTPVGVTRQDSGTPAIIQGGVPVDDDSDVVEAENLLEAYFMQIDTIAKLLHVLDEHVDDTEDYINIELDFKRNELIQLELLLTTGTFSLAIYSVVAGIFGMNLSLPNTSFSVVILSTLGACLLAFLIVLYYCWKRRLLFR